jgi:hypothetical protein
MATACWAFIVAKSPLLKTAPMPGFCDVAAPQQEISSTAYQQARPGNVRVM